MPSPIAHAAMGYGLYQICRPLRRQECSRHIGPVPPLLMATVGLSLLPDMDVVVGILMGDLGRFHNNVMNSLIVGLVVALGIGAVGWFRQSSGFGKWFIIALLCYETHVMMDFFTIGRGVMILWPFSSARYEPAVKLFYGLHWSDGWISVRHLWTLLTELGYVLFVGVILGVAHKCLPGKTAPLGTHLLEDGGDRVTTRPLDR